MGRYGYRTRRDFYKNVNWCRAERTEGKLSIKPHKRDKPGLWTDLPAEKTVVIPATRDMNVLGASMRLALNNCE